MCEESDHIVKSEKRNWRHISPSSAAKGQSDKILVVDELWQL
uniref:Uncharacterized protein n=1 Tax=Anguilla anguilla TaxID=7936 RepID=A0A0E9UQL7_ANGAN